MKTGLLLSLAIAASTLTTGCKIKVMQGAASDDAVIVQKEEKQPQKGAVRVFRDANSEAGSAEVLAAPNHRFKNVNAGGSFRKSAGAGVYYKVSGGLSYVRQ
jgi:predicted small secreted protein